MLDEADRLLDKIDSDFAQDLDAIFEELPKERLVQYSNESCYMIMFEYD